MGEVILDTVSKTKNVGQNPLQYKSSGCKIIYCYSCEQRLRWGGGKHPKAGAVLAYLVTDCALGSGCHFVFSYRVNS
jgi:hypothetical protein